MVGHVQLCQGVSGEGRAGMVDKDGGQSTGLTNELTEREGSSGGCQ